MPRKQTTAKASTEAETDRDALRVLLADVPGLSISHLNDEIARVIRFLEARPALRSALRSGTLTGEQLLAMVQTQATVALGESSDAHTRAALDRYLGHDRRD